MQSGSVRLASGAEAVVRESAEMLEYAEDYVSIVEGWTDMLNRYADDGWRFVQAVTDEIDQDGSRHKGRHRLIFERRRDDGEDEDG